MFGHTNEPVTLERDVTAVIIPIGETVTLREGTPGFITQALGGSYHGVAFLERDLFNCSSSVDSVGMSGMG